MRDGERRTEPVLGSRTRIPGQVYYQSTSNPKKRSLALLDVKLQGVAEERGAYTRYISEAETPWYSQKTILRFFPAPGEGHRETQAGKACVCYSTVHYAAFSAKPGPEDCCRTREVTEL